MLSNEQLNILNIPFFRSVFMQQTKGSVQRKFSNYFSNLWYSKDVLSWIAVCIKNLVNFYGLSLSLMSILWNYCQKLTTPRTVELLSGSKHCLLLSSSVHRELWCFCVTVWLNYWSARGCKCCCLSKKGFRSIFSNYPWSSCTCLWMLIRFSVGCCQHLLLTWTVISFYKHKVC